MSRQSESEVSAIATAALNYRAAGWSVVPLRPRDKRPLIEWERFQHERASSATVTEWYRRWPDANVGVVTGEISNLVVLDIDPNHGGDASIGRLERQIAPLPAWPFFLCAQHGRDLRDESVARTSPSQFRLPIDRTSFAPETTSPKCNERDRNQTKIQQNQRS